MTRATAKSSYHHGNLREALVEVAIEIIEESGVAAFSLAEACRRLGVSPGAPYRHFQDREQVLVAVAVHGCELLAAMLHDNNDEHAAPTDRIATLCRTYVLFAAHHQALFEAIYSEEVYVGGNPALVTAVRAILEEFMRPAQLLPDATPQQKNRIVLGATAAALGYAISLRTGTFRNFTNAEVAAAENAANAARAIIAGRDELDGAPFEPQIRFAGLTL